MTDHPGETSESSGENDDTTIVSTPQAAEDTTQPSDYEVLGVIGRGAYGEVRLVRDRAGKYWAVKTVYRSSFSDANPYEREYKGILKFEPVSRLSKNQLQIIHVGRRDEAGYFYYIIELADDKETGRRIEPGSYAPRTLRSDLQKHRRLPFPECISIAISLAEALRSIHQHGLIHRDIKPSNIIFVDGIPKLADIGLIAGRDEAVSYVGTEGFIPREGPGTAAADIYGFGKVLYQMWTGMDRLKFPELPDDLDRSPDHKQFLQLNQVVAKACANDPKKRYQTTDQLLADLEALASGKPHKREGASRWLIAFALLCVILTVCTLGGIRYFGQRGPKPSTTVPVAALLSKKCCAVDKQADCVHKCCQKAAARGQICSKCHDCCLITEQKRCEHKCCQRAAVIGIPCSKCHS